MGTRALVMVDIQKDFMPGGSLEVPEGDAVVPVANALQERFDLVVATKDWHPPDHASFVTNHEGKEPFQVIEWNGLEQILWPPHCIQGSGGAEFHPDLNLDGVAEVFEKGTDKDLDSYSGFFDNGHRHSTGLGKYLKEEGVDTVYLVGVATDVCVKFTALDARRLGFETWLVEDGCRGVDVQEGDVEKALRELEDAGVRRTTSKEVPA